MQVLISSYKSDMIMVNNEWKISQIAKKLHLGGYVFEEPLSIQQFIILRVKHVTWFPINMFFRSANDAMEDPWHEAEWAVTIDSKYRLSTLYSNFPIIIPTISCNLPYILFMG